MDKRREANQRVKNSITSALLELMHTKPFSAISITELIRTAGVARASFYRNYSSKEEVLTRLVDDVLEQFRAETDLDGGDFYTYANIHRSFVFFKKYRGPALQLCRFGYGSIVLEKLNRFHEEIAGTMPATSILRYRLYMYIGCLFNTAITWLQNGARETPRDMARMFCETMNLPLPEEDFPEGDDNG